MDFKKIFASVFALLTGIVSIPVLDYDATFAVVMFMMGTVLFIDGIRKEEED